MPLTSGGNQPSGYIPVVPVSSAAAGSNAAAASSGGGGGTAKSGGVGLQYGTYGAAYASYPGRVIGPIIALGKLSNNYGRP